MKHAFNSPNVWRLKTKPPHLCKAKRQLLIDEMLNENFIGTGWPITSHTGGNLSRDKSIELLKSEYINKHNVPVRFVNDTVIGDLIWIVDLDGHYHLARIQAEYRYNKSSTDWKKELAHQFPCEWIHTKLLSSEVPSGVKNALLQGQAYCRINNPSAKNYTRILADRDSFQVQENDEFLQLIGHEALEDLVGLYLQMKLKGFLLPSSAKRSNAAYEFVIISGDGEREAIVQVKSGASSIEHTLESPNAECYLFAVNNDYPSELNQNKIITQESLVKFAYQNRNILPRTITCWMTKNTNA